MKDKGEPLKADYCQYTALKNACCRGRHSCPLCEFRKGYLWVFIKNEKINDKTKYSGLSNDSLITSN